MTPLTSLLQVGREAFRSLARAIWVGPVTAAADADLDAAFDLVISNGSFMDAVAFVRLYSLVTPSHLTRN